MRIRNAKPSSCCAGPIPSARSQSSLFHRIAPAACALGISLFFILWPKNESAPPPEAEPSPAQAGPTAPTKNAEEAPTPVFAPDLAHRFDFAREGVLGTSFDLRVIADDRRIADAVEARILKEIEYRESLISTYRTNSEIGRLNLRPFDPEERVPISLSLWLLLDECRFISQRSEGAFNAFTGNVTRLWKQAAEQNSAPDPTLLHRASATARAGFRLSGRKEGEWVRRLAPGSFDFDAISKGYVIDKSVREAVKDFPSLRGLRLDIGGEIKVWGRSDYARDRPWTIGVADPENPADNAPPLTRLELRNLAGATSGNYARPIRIGRRMANHVFDPRT